MTNPYPNKVPAGFPDAGTFVIRQVNEDWLGVVIGACERLKYRYWVDSNGDPIEDAAIFDQLILMLQTEVSVPAERQIGELVVMTAPSSDPSLLYLDGSTVNRADYPDLADLYGVPSGDATFMLPDYRQRFLRGAASESGAGSVGGQDTFTITNNNLPAHTHNAPQHYPNYWLDANATAHWDLATGATYDLFFSQTPQATSTQNEGGINAPIDNRPAYVHELYYVVAL